MLGILDEEFGGPTKSSSITSLSRLVAFLRFFAEGGYQHGVGKDYDVGMTQPTVSKTISLLLNVFERKLCSIWINFIMDESEVVEAKQDFYSKAMFPGVVMCVDGTHVKLTAPSSETFLFFNRKGWYSLNVMIVSLI